MQTVLNYSLKHPRVEINRGKYDMPFVILDRDGVINFETKNYVKSPDEWEAIPGSLEAIARLYRAGIRVVIATNQS